MDIVTLGLGLLSGGAGGLLGGKLTGSAMGKGGQVLTGILGGTGLAAVAQYIPGISGLFASPAGGASMNASSLLGGLASGGVGGTILSMIIAKVKGGSA